MAITSTGLTIKRYEQILAELQSALRSYLGKDIDLTENALLGILNIIYANSQAEQWEMAQAVYNAFNIEGATGKQLDDLVQLVGLSRLSEAYSVGTVEVTGVNNTVVPTGTEFRTNDTKISVYTNEDITISTASCFRVSLSIANTVTQGISYILAIKGRNYSYTAKLGDKIQDVMVRLTSDINNDAVATWSAAYELGSNILTITAGDISYPMNINVGLYWKINSVSSVGSATLGTTGNIIVGQQTVTAIVTPLLGLLSVNNSSEFSIGRFEETDDELRARHAVSTSIIGASSVKAIEAKIRQVSGVSYAQLFENKTLITDDRGIPAKSFEVVVDGGSDKVVAEVLFSAKPTGISTYGNTAVTITDIDGDLQGVFISRPVTVPVYVQVFYQLYDEELFPTNGEDLIRTAVVATANKLVLGEDVIAQRFFGDIFRNIQGISNLKITVGLNNKPTASRLSVDASERASITFENVTTALGN